MKPYELPIDPIPHTQFTRSGSTLVAEASSLGRFLNRLYDDACDVGLAIQGRQRVEKFYLDREEQRDGETVAWHFKPIDRALPITVTIFND